MKNIFVLILTISACFGAYSQSLKPIEDSVGKLKISIDPRIEALSAIQVISNYRLANFTSEYSKEVQEYFSALSSSQAVKLTQELLMENGFAYDAPPNFMFYLSQVPQLERKLDYSDYLIKKAGGADKLEEYREAIKQFVNEPRFEKFWSYQSEFYRRSVEATIAEFAENDPVKALEEYYNETQNSYNIVICPLFGYNNYGFRIPAGNDKYDIYSLNSTQLLKDGVPYLNYNQTISLVWHEFSHSFVNPLTERHLDKVNSYGKLFEPIQEPMSKQAYTSWEICVNEHIVRAVVIRLYERNIGMKEASQLMIQELSKQFIYINPIVEKLKEFEKLRDTKNITFSDFYPQLIEVFNNLDGQAMLSANNQFAGTVNRIFQSPKLAWIYPTNGDNQEELNAIKEYMASIIERFKSRIGLEGNLLISDSEALEASLSDYGILAYGTIESNLFLSRYKSSFPFKIENGTLYAGKEYTTPEVKIITCVPNPQNNQRGMAIYSALSNKSILDINSVSHGPEDYIIFLNRETVLDKGFYDKKDIWKFED